MKMKLDIERRAVCHAILNGSLPESALQWPIVVVVPTTVLRGSGESTTFHGMVTIRENGKQVWRGPSWQYEGRKPLLERYGDQLHSLGSLGRGRQLYVVKAGAQ